MILISTTELKTNMSRYLSLVEKEDVFITRNGKTVAKLVTQKPNKKEIAESLFGVLKGHEIDEVEIKRERLSKK